MKSAAIGIDLGTTYSCVAVWVNGCVEIIANDQGNRTTPSYVAFTEKGRLVGDAAAVQAAVNPRNTVFDAKRLIGRKFKDEHVQKDIKLWPFTVVDADGKPKIKVQEGEEENLYHPEQISSMVLAKLKETAEAYLETEVKEVVITVPAYFNDAQRQSTKDAGKIAGLNVLRIINEPTAAALAYGLEKNLQGTKNVLIFDLGGGTFDVSILTIKEGSTFEVKATTGDTHLGGEDFDHRLVAYLIKEFKKKSGHDVSKDMKAVRRLRTAAERAKRMLSTAAETNFMVDALSNGEDFSTKITRARFEELCEDLFKNTLEPVEKALKDAEMSIKDIDDVVLVGGSTRIPKVQSILQDFFKGKKLNLNLHPDEAVAYGAAVQAAMLSGEEGYQIKDVVLFDVTPLSLGLEIVGGAMARVVKRNTTIPCSVTSEYCTAFNNQTTAEIAVFEGERKVAKKNNPLGKFTLNGIPAAKAGEPLDVNFNIDDNGILHVTARCKRNGNTADIVIKNEKGRLSEEEIEKMLRDAAKHKAQDKILRENARALAELEMFMWNKVKHALKNKKRSMTADAYADLTAAAEETSDWLGENPHPELFEIESEFQRLHEIYEAAVGVDD